MKTLGTCVADREWKYESELCETKPRNQYWKQTEDDDAITVHQLTTLFFFSSSMGPLDAIIGEALRIEIGHLADVEVVCMKKEENTYHVWSIVNNSSEAIEDRIYDAELKVMKRFGSTYFDFLVVSRKNRDLKDILPTSATVVFRTE